MVLISGDEGDDMNGSIIMLLTDLVLGREK
jgi:hypothetical protein